MSRFKLTFQFIGSNYCGWQRQANGLTIQEVIESKLSHLFQQEVKVMGCSRTDAGVHALKFVCHFDLNEKKSGIHKRDDFLFRCFQGLQGLLPDDIAPIKIEAAPEGFHSIISSKKKVYDYYILNAASRDVFMEPYSWRIPHKLNISLLKKAAKHFVGTHDFRAFCASDTRVKSTVRTINAVSIQTIQPSTLGLGQIGPFSGWQLKEGRLIRLRFTGEGFLKQMVRNMVGTLSEVGRAKLSPNEVCEVMKSKDRKRAGMTAPAKGLFLKDVLY